ncbi:RNA-binding S4 domain-containing protein [Aquihabitans sp. McL0605]|uniref:RNA-binding S4 domain-containing protein n=1 Tax=Aquihabitans sp. McL0605 TaxID=3415671 RepID=UPI003CF61EBE
MRQLAIADDMIRLGQLLQLAGWAEGGAEAKHFITDGEARVNGEIETRRGRQLHPGDVVELFGEQLQLVHDPDA